MILPIAIAISLTLGFLIGRNLKIIRYYDRLTALEKEKQHWHEIACRQKPPPWRGGPE